MGTNTANGSEVRGLLQPFYTLKNENENRVQIQELLELESLKKINKYEPINIYYRSVCQAGEKFVLGGDENFMYMYLVFTYT